MVQLGEVRQELAKDLQRAVFKLVDEKKHLKGLWWIFITSQWKYRMIQGPGQALATKQRVLHTPLFAMNTLPPQIRSGVMKGILIEVDNRSGKVEVKWNLPKDMCLDGLSLDDQIVESVCRSAELAEVPILG